MSEEFSRKLKQAFLLAEENKFSQACELLSSSIKSTNLHYVGYLLLSKCLYHSGKHQEAIAKAQEAERLDPLQKEFQLIQINIQQGKLAKAENIALSMLKRIVGHPRAIFTLVHTSQQFGLLEKSLHYLKLGLNVSPANIQLRALLVNTLESLGRYEGMLLAARDLVHLTKKGEHSLSLLALLLKYALYNEVLETCESIKKTSSNTNATLSEVELLRAHAYRILGSSDSCISALKASLTAKPDNPNTWAALADLKTYKFSSEDTSRLERLSQTADLNQRHKSLLLFALARAREQQKGSHESFKTYQQANALFAKIARYKPQNTDEELGTRKRVFNMDCLKTQASLYNNDAQPIFIVGLPRSGSTLLEQMLAGHSCVQSTIEQPTVSAIERRVNEFCIEQFGNGLFSSIDKLTSQHLGLINDYYYKCVSLFLRGKPRFFIDKLPFNFRQVGLIHKILPNAIIVDIRRNPLDCGLSLFKQYFPSGVNFSYQQKHIGHFYNQYIGMMEHWNTVLPNRVIHIQYEQLVTDPHSELNKIFSAMGLNVETECLEFHKNKQVIHTASSEQVRQPLNRHGIGRWLNVKQELTELKQSIEPSILQNQQRYMRL